MDKRVFIGFTILIAVIAGVIYFTTRPGGESAANATQNDLFASSSPNSLAAPSQNAQASPTAAATPARKSYSSYPGDMSADQLKNKKAVMETSKGVIEFEVYPEATKAASNFVFLATDKFYDGLTFHRYEPGFVIQGGDPLGNGRGGPGYKFADDPVKRKYEKGTVAMANSGPNTNGSQFFIVLVDNPPLQPLYSIFGKVTKGLDVVDKIRVGDVITKVTIESLK